LAQNEETEEEKNRDTSNAPKPFLKRKTQKVAGGFQKLNWKAGSRIDCWKKEEEQEAQTARDQSRGAVQRAKSTRQANRSPTPNNRPTEKNSAARRTVRDKSASKPPTAQKSQRTALPPKKAGQ